jgi:polar amino acid transport system substrate-binding protein
MKKSLIMVCILLHTALSGFCGFAAENEILAVTEVWPPFRIPEKHQKGQFNGIDIDLLQKIEASLSTPITIKRLPWARCLEFMKSGRADIITGLAYTTDRAQHIHYCGKPYYTVAPVFFLQKGNGNKITTYEDLYRFKIGYSIGSAYFEPFNSDPKLQKIGISTEKQLLGMLLRGRLPVIIGTDCNIAYDLVQMGAQHQVEKAQYEPDQKTDLYVGVSRKSPLFKKRDRIAQLIATLVETGTIDQIADRYLK